MAAENTLAVIRDYNGVPIWGLPFPPDSSLPGVIPKAFRTNLPALAEQTLTVPLDVDTALLFYAPNGVWVGNSPNPIGVPGPAFAPTGALLDPTSVVVKPGDTLRFTSSNTTQIGVFFVRVKP